MASTLSRWRPRWHPNMTPWLIALAVCAAAVLARTDLIQPPAIAHGCETNPTWWCAIRLGIIYTYAFHTVGQVAIAMALLSLVFGRIWLAASTLALGFMALVLYCYEPGAIAVVSGALLLARLQQARCAPGTLPMPQDRHAQQ